MTSRPTRSPGREFPHRRIAAADRRKSLRDKPHQLGVLFVHGIGGQRPGEILVRWGESIAAWLAIVLGPFKKRAWGTRLRAPLARLGNQPDEPAHFELEIDDPKPGTSWVFAEAWWAETFAQPKYSELVSWSLRTVPNAIGLHFGRQIQRHFRNRSWLKLLLGAVGGLVLGLAFAPLLVLFLAALLVLGAIPIAQIRDWVQMIQRVLAGSLGDSLILLDSPIQAAAIRSVIRDRLSWLEKVSEQIVIVAHSQGAELAVEAISSQGGGYSPPKKLSTLITYGAGINKLSRLRWLLEKPWTAWLASAILLGIALVGWRMRQAALAGTLGWSDVWPVLIYIGSGFVLALLHFLALLLGRLFPNANTGGVIRFVFTVLGLATLIATLIVFDVRLLVLLPYWLAIVGLGVIINFLSSASPPLGISLPGSIRTWKDFHASADPVSNGPIVTRRAGWPESTEISNLDSSLADHTTYWQNREQFVAPVVATLASAAGLALPHFGEGRPELARGSTWRDQRVAWRTRAKVLLMVATAILLIVQRNRLEDLGRVVAEVFADGLAPFVGAASTWAPRTQGVLATSVGGALFTIVCAIGLYALLALTWRGWNAAEMGAFEKRREKPPFWPQASWLTLLGCSLALILLGAPTASVIASAWQGSSSPLAADLEVYWSLALAASAAFGTLAARFRRRARSAD